MSSARLVSPSPVIIVISQNNEAVNTKTKTYHA